MSKKKVAWFLVLSIMGLIAGYIFTNSIKFKICNVTKTITEASCINFYERLGDPLLYGMGALAFVFLLLLLLPNALSAWQKFAKWFIPIATLLFIFYPNPSSGDYFSPYPEQVFQWVSILYVLVSIVIIVITFLKNKKQPTLVQ